jgi:hypothetical protein
VDQISPPFRIALVALLAVCALWFTVLRPKAPTAAEPPAAPGVTGLANDVSAAKDAAATSAAANAATQAATGGATATTGKTAPKTASKSATATSATRKAKPAVRGAHAAVAGKSGHVPAAAANPSTPLLRAIDDKRAVVLLFWNRKGSEDRAVRKAVDATSRRGGDVVVKVAPVKDVARYGAITRGARVLQSPTVLVLAPGRKARPIVGFTTTGEIEQAVGDALAAVK